MSQGVSIAVVGATGAVGREFLNIIEQRRFPVSEIRLFASQRSVGSLLSVNGRQIVVEEPVSDCFQGVDIAFISVSTPLSQQLAPQAVDAGALVVDDSAAFRMQPQVPLVVPEVNGRDVEDHHGIISIPNCATTQMVMALAPLHRANPIKRIIVDTYQSVSGAGSAAITELKEQTETTLRGGKIQPDIQGRRIAFNLFPHIGDFLATGYTEEEEKLVGETKKILHAPHIAVSATCVRVPVYISHSEAVHIELDRPMSVGEAMELLKATPGINVVDDADKGYYPMPWDVAGTDEVYVGRIRQDLSHPNGLALWIVADNLRKGAALNAVQIAEEVLHRGCLSHIRTGASA